MRRSMGVLVLCCLACKGENPMHGSGLTTAPPTLYPIGTTSAVAVAGGAPVLKVSVTLHNYTSVHLQAVVSASCPFAVRIFPDSIGAYAYIGVVGCPAGRNAVDVAPADSVVLTRMISADSLATLARGTYGVNVLVGTTTGSIGAWAGTIQLPISAALVAR